MSQGSNNTGSLLDLHELVPGSEQVTGVWPTVSGTAFYVTDRAVYETTLSDTSGWLQAIPFEEITGFKVEHVEHSYEPNFENALLWGSLGVLVAGYAGWSAVTAEGSPEPTAILLGLVGFVFFCAAIVSAIIELGKQDSWEYTRVKLRTRDGSTETFKVKEIVGEDVVPALAKSNRRV